MTRRLAAILAADVVGYSALMAEDEAGTLEALRRLRREVFHPSVAGHRGKVVKAMGDGWLVEFSSAVDAVNAAVAVQVGLERDEAIRLRVGIHLGDITHEDEDIYGDGVNVAARLEALAEPGAVVISDAVYGSLDGTLTPSFEDAGGHALKNIPRPVRVWLRRGTTAEPAADVQSRTGGARDHKVPIAIEPFRTGDGRAEVRELAAALTGDLSRCLAEGRWYRGVVSERPRPDAYRLGGNLRARGDRIRLEVEITAPDGAEIWSGKFDGRLDDVFDWQDETAASLAAEAGLIIGDLERHRLDALGDAAMTVPELVLRTQLWQAGAVAENRLAIRLLRAAMARDEGWVMPPLIAVYLVGGARLTGFADDLGVTAAEEEAWFARAEALADGSADCQALLADLRYRRARDHDADQFRATMNAVLRHAPYHQQALFACGTIYLWRGETEAAASHYGKLRSIDGAPIVRALLSVVLVQADRGEEALRHAREAVEITPDGPFALRGLAAALAHAGRIDEAREAAAKLLRLYPRSSIGALKRAAPWSENPATRRYFDALRAAGVPE